MSSKTSEGHSWLHGSFTLCLVTEDQAGEDGSGRQCAAGVALTADSYHAWLAEKAVQFVAVPDAELSWPGRTEAAMVTAGLRACW